jgi:integrase
VGAHRLRHTLATDMLRAGASLPQVGQMLRHRSDLSTARRRSPISTRASIFEAASAAGNEGRNIHVVRVDGPEPE